MSLSITSTIAFSRSNAAAGKAARGPRGRRRHPVRTADREVAAAALLRLDGPHRGDPGGDRSIARSEAPKAPGSPALIARLVRLLSSAATGSAAGSAPIAKFACRGLRIRAWPRREVISTCLGVTVTTPVLLSGRARKGPVR